MQLNQQTMSSLEIAELTGKNHPDVLRDIRNVLQQAEIGESKFASTYLSAQNKELPCYNLPKRECDLVISGYSVKYRLAIIDRWQELETSQPSIENLSRVDILKLAKNKYTEPKELSCSELSTYRLNEPSRLVGRVV